MSLSAAVLDALIATGATREQLAAVMHADIAEREAEEAAKLEAKRAKDRDRQRRHRQSRSVTVTGCDKRDAVPPNEELLTPSSTDLPDEASASSPVRQPVTQAFGIWNEVAPTVGWPIAQSLTPTRQKLTAARLRQHGLEGWRAAIARARASPYLGGTDPPSWFTFDWFIKAANFQKLIEGNYDRQRTSDQARPSGWETAYHANAGPVGAPG